MIIIHRQFDTVVNSNVLQTDDTDGRKKSVDKQDSRPNLSIK